MLCHTVRALHDWPACVVCCILNETVLKCTSEVSCKDVSLRFILLRLIARPGASVSAACFLGSPEQLSECRFHSLFTSIYRAAQQLTYQHRRCSRHHINQCVASTGSLSTHAAGAPSTFSAASATSPAVSAAFLSSSARSSAFFKPSAALSPPIDATSFFTTSTVGAGPPGSAASTFPLLSTTKTPRVVPFGAFFKPIALISVKDWSHRSGYGRFCFVLKVVLAFGLSLLSP